MPFGERCVYAYIADKLIPSIAAPSPPAGFQELARPALTV